MPDPGFFLRVSRPRFWIYVLGPYIVGLVAAAGSRFDLYHLGAAVFAIYFLLPANLLIYGVNDIFDYETDRLNAKKQGYEELVAPSSRKPLVLNMLALNLPFFIVAFILMPGTAAALAGFYFFSVFYSAPPIRAKAIPFLDSAFNVLYVFPGIFSYKMLSGEYPPLDIIIASAAWTAAMHAYSAIPDIAADRDANLSTIATTLGSTGTHIFCLVMYLLAAGLSFKYLGWIGVVLTSVYSAMVITSLFQRGETKTFRVYKLFPLINSICGFLIFWYIALPKLLPITLP